MHFNVNEYVLTTIQSIYIKNFDFLKNNKFSKMGHKISIFYIYS